VHYFLIISETTMSGFTAVKKQGAGQTAGMVQTYAVDAAHSTLLAPGDAIVITGDSDTNGVGEVDTGNATTANTGVIVAVDYQLAGESLTETGLPATTAGTLKVNMDPLQNYEIEADATVAAAAVGLNVGINVTTATKTGGLTVSNMTVDTATAAGTQTLPYRIVALLEGVTSGVLGDRVLVRPNASTYSDGAAGV
jgi:hypothetical protein